MAFMDDFESHQSHLGLWTIQHRSTGQTYGKSYETEEQAWFWFDLIFNKQRGN